jgi:hypothetical protein
MFVCVWCVFVRCVRGVLFMGVCVGGDKHHVCVVCVFV